MSTVLDLIGSCIIASIVILLGLRLNATVANSATAASVERDNQESLVNAVRVIEHDLRKIGFNQPTQTPVVTVADSNRFRFRADLEGDKIIDSVEWYVGTKLLLGSNPQARALYRRCNGGTPVVLGYGSMKFIYRKNDGTLTTNPSEVKSVEVRLNQVGEFAVRDRVVSEEKMANPEVFWRQARPVNRVMKRRA